jgi:hypothetical protein
VTGSLEELEHRIAGLRARLRRLLLAGDRAGARAARAELRQAEQEWDTLAGRLAPAVATGAPGAAGEGAQPAPQPARGGTGGGTRAQAQARDGTAAQAGPAVREVAAAGHARLLPIREQVYQALTLLGVPSSHRLLVAVQDAFFGPAPPAARLTSLRRDEERSFRAAPFARPYYICAALTADLLAPARGVLAVSAWPMELRVIGPLSPRVNYLSAAIRVAESVRRAPEPGPAALRLLRRFAVNIPGAAGERHAARPERVIEAARAELAVHRDADESHRRAAARRARAQLDEAGQLFGAGLRLITGAQAGA